MLPSYNIASTIHKHQQKIQQFTRIATEQQLIMDGRTYISPTSDQHINFEPYFNQFLPENLSGLPDDDCRYFDSYWTLSMTPSGNESLLSWDFGDQTNLNLTPECSAEMINNNPELSIAGQHLQLEQPFTELFDFPPESFTSLGPLSLESSCQDLPYAYDQDQATSSSPATSMASSVARSSHSSEHIHVCNICNKEFKQKGLLRRHTQIHTRPFHCTKCPSHFAEKRDLNRHMPVHQSKSAAAKDRFECNVHDCDKTFGRKDNLLKHLKKIHRALTP